MDTDMLNDIIMSNRFYQAPEIDVDELFSDGCICGSCGDNPSAVPDTTEDIVDGGENPW